MERLFTPWRLPYISRKADPDEACFLCRAGQDPADPERLVVHTTPHHLVLLNRHPYTNGHLMVAPLAHLAAPEEQGEEERAELWPLVLLCRRVLEETYRPDGMNLGANLGRAAGAGVPGHFHLHVVPRWLGDSNFMSVTSGTRIIPEDLVRTWERPRERFAASEARR
jgi:ATP adenylyltransferase